MVKTVFLVGYMGSGKTSVGKTMSKIDNYEFYDLDQYIEEMEGKKVSEIFKDYNEVFFRKIENRYLKKLCLLDQKKIISTGGGTPCFQNNLDLIKSTPGSISVYLKTNIDNLLKRLIDSKSERPLISHVNNENDLKEFIGKHLFERGFYYEKSDLVIDTNDKSISEVADNLKRLLI